MPIDGEPFHAEIAAIDAEGKITFRMDQTSRTMPAADLVRWGHCPEQGGAGGLVLADGGWLAAEIVAANQETLTARSELFGEIKLPLAALSGVVFRPPSVQADRDQLIDRIVQGETPPVDSTPAGAGQGDPNAEPLDRLLLDNGDELAGRLAGITGETIQWQSEVGPIDVMENNVTAMSFNTRSTLKSPGGQFAWIGLNDGSRLLVSQIGVEGDSLRIDLAGQTLSAARANLVFLQPSGGRVVYLSDLKPAEYHQMSYLDLPWPYRNDRNVSGGLLRGGGRLYLKGLGVHSAARLVYEISPLPLGEGQGVRADDETPATLKGTAPLSLTRKSGQSPYNRFSAELAIDDSTAGGGSVQFRVLVDGQEKFASPILRGGDRPLPVSVDVSGAKTLELQVDYADRIDVLDRADWLDARLTTGE